MINKLHNWAIIAASTSLSLTVFEIAPTQAADFASFAFSFGSAYGELYFQNTKLAGVGIESASLSELSSEAEFSFFADPYIIPSDSGEIDYLPPEAYGFRLEEYNPVFTFDSGNLVGINLSETREYYNSNPDNDTANPVPGEYLDSFGSSGLDLLNNSYQAYLSGVAYFTSQGCAPDYIFDDEGNIIGGDCYYEVSVREVSLTDSGAISFTTNDPIERIPEPLTIIGTGTAIGFGTFFKRQIGKKQQKDKLKA